MPDNELNAVNGVPEENITEAVEPDSEQPETSEGEPETTDSEPELTEAAESDVSGSPRPVFRLRTKKKIYEITAEDDISFKGYLSYRHLKMLAWLLIVMACLGSVLTIYAGVTGSTGSDDAFISILQYGKELSVPLLLIASFAAILNGFGEYKKAIIVNGSIALALVGGFFLIYERFAIPGMEAFSGSRQNAVAAIDAVFADPESNGFFSFNIFIDLTLCTLVLFFINYNPKKYFQGRKIYLFRALVLLPVAYEIASICLKVLASAHAITLPIQIFPFLTTKPPVSFLIFIVIARYFKETEHKFIKHGRTHEDYLAYLKTNHNSFRFSRFLVITIFVFAMVDFFLMVIMAVLHIAASGNISDLSEERMMETMDIVMDWGFGKTMGLLSITPLLLLFSYTRTHKNKLIDALIPIGGILGVVIVYFDGLFRVICAILRKSFEQYH